MRFCVFRNLCGPIFVYIQPSDLLRMPHFGQIVFILYKEDIPECIVLRLVKKIVKARKKNISVLL